MRAAAEAQLARASARHLAISPLTGAASHQILDPDRQILHAFARGVKHRVRYRRSRADTGDFTETLGAQRIEPESPARR